MRVLVAGATGVLGRQVVPRLIERGHEVRALVRREEQAERLRRMGLDAVLGDVLDRESLFRAAEGREAALHLATAIPRVGEAQDYSLNDRIRREGTANLLGACAAAGARRYVQQSITLLYGVVAGRDDEDAPLQPGASAASAADMEALVRASPLEWCILRGGLFYGPNTGREEDWRRRAREGTLHAPSDAGQTISLVHVVDMARAVVAALEAAPAGSTYNLVDDEPVSYRALSDYIAAQIGAPKPSEGAPSTPPFPACSNGRIRRDLGWTPAYPSYRSGLA